MLFACLTCSIFLKSCQYGTQGSFATSCIPEGLRSTGPGATAAGGGQQQGAPGGEDFTASFALPEMTPGMARMRLELSPIGAAARRVRLFVGL